MPLDRAIVIEASVAPGSSVAHEPVTTAVLKDERGGLTRVRIVGGPNAHGGITRLAGYVIPAVGATIRLDLREEPDASGLEAGARPLPAWMPNTPAAIWLPSAFPVSFALAVPNVRDLGDASLSELEVALRTWPEVGCTAFRSRFGGVTDKAADDDGVNAIFWHLDTWPAELVPGTLGQTIVHADAAGNMHDADIHLNGADFRWSLDGAGATVDARSVLVHELGHALGLGHSADARATMFVTRPPGIGWRSLEQDDKTGLCALYPGTGSAACDTGAPCPSGFVCVARTCERLGARGEVCSPCARVPSACEGAGDDARCIDIGDGASAGRVCARACATGAGCGPRFACASTTASGDLQCVPVDGCASGPNPCTTDAQCAGALCRRGACVGPPDPIVADAGSDASTDSSPDAATDGGEVRLSPAGGCSAARTPKTPGEREKAGLEFLFLLLLASLASWRRSPSSS